MTTGRIITWPVKIGAGDKQFTSDEVDHEPLKQLLGWYPVLNHFVWSCGRGVVESAIARTALLLAAHTGSYNTDTNLALRKLLEARDLHRHTNDRTLVDNPR